MRDFILDAKASEVTTAWADLTTIHDRLWGVGRGTNGDRGSARKSVARSYILLVDDEEGGLRRPISKGLSVREGTTDAHPQRACTERP